MEIVNRKDITRGHVAYHLKRHLPTLVSNNKEKGKKWSYTCIKWDQSKETQNYCKLTLFILTYTSLLFMVISVTQMKHLSCTYNVNQNNTPPTNKKGFNLSTRKKLSSKHVYVDC